MSERIKSVHEWIAGDEGDGMIFKPKRATVIYDARGEPLYKCPQCGNVADMDECDCLGAEPGCLFCNKCNCEFET